MFKFLGAGALAVASLAAVPASATVIDFDNLASTYTGGAYSEDGYILSANFCNSTSGLCIQPVNPANSIDPDGVSVVKASGAAVTFTVRREDGGLFQFGSMDFGKTAVDTTPPYTASGTYQFNFTLADDSVVQRYFTVPFNDPSPISIHTAVFEGLGDIRQFTFRNQSAALQFDNISLVDNMGAVPEPGSWAMMIAGFGLVGGALRRGGAGRLAAA